MFGFLKLAPRVLGKTKKNYRREEERRREEEEEEERRREREEEKEKKKRKGRTPLCLCKTARTEERGYTDAR